MRGFILRISAIISIGLSVGCGDNRASVADQYLGSWRFSRQNSHKILTFRANGTFLGEIRVEGRLAKIIEKKEQVNGAWNVTEEFLHMTPTEDGSVAGWVAGQTVNFEVLEISSTNLKLRGENGVIENYQRVKSQKQEKEAAKLSTLVMKPIVVNLKNTAPGATTKYFCIELELTMEDTDGTMQAPLGIHPRAQEAALLHISTLTYLDVNTMDKIGELNGTLFLLLRPYFGGKLKEVSVKNVLVTADWKNTEEFIKKIAEEGSNHKPS